MLIRLMSISLAALLPLAAAAADAPKVVASIKPIHSLVSAVMEGRGKPRLLVPATASEHSYSLKPSDAKALAEAHLVFWIGAPIETPLVKTMATHRAKAVALLDVPGLDVLDSREGGIWSAHDHGHGHSHAHGKDAADERDGHVWKDPQRAMVLADAIAAALGRADPEGAARYAANAGALKQRLAALDAELAATLAPVRTRRYVVFHDAYQYFEARYGLAAAGSITVSPERAPGAKRLSELRKLFSERGAVCAFAEPQVKPAVLDTLVKGTTVRSGVLDGLGAGIPEGPDAYFTMMRGLAASLVGCLAGTA